MEINQIPISKGVLQASVLSPIIFNIYIDDLIEELVNKNGEQHTFAYADDIMVFQRDWSQTEKNITLIKLWC